MSDSFELVWKSDVVGEFLSSWKSMISSLNAEPHIAVIEGEKYQNKRFVESEFDTILIPEGFSEEQTIDFIREKILERGGDPDTAFPLCSRYNIPKESECPCIATMYIRYDLPKDRV